MGAQFKGRWQAADPRHPGELHDIEPRWVETRNNLPDVVPYEWRGPRSRFAALTRARIEVELAELPDE